MELAEGQLKVMDPETEQVNTVSHKSYQKKQMFAKYKINPRSNIQFSQQTTALNSRKQTCKRCNRVHFEPSKCPAVAWKCFSCGQIGHTAKCTLCKAKVNDLDEELEHQESNLMNLLN